MKNSVYGEEAGQALDDEAWLRDAGERNWVVFMKDDRIRRRPSERDALTAARVRAFCLTNAQLRAAEQTARFVDKHRPHPVPSRAAGAYIYGVYDGYIKRLWP